MKRILSFMLQNTGAPNIDAAKMSVNVANIPDIMLNGKGGEYMAKKNLKDIMISLLQERASDEEQQMLRESGFATKRPTRQTVIMAALYKKAAAGDLSAIREMRSIIGESVSDAGFGVVRIIDDIGH